MFNQKVNNHFDWELHQKMMSEIIEFLESQQMIPTKLSIHADGWAEAQFISENSLRNLWQKLESLGTVELEHPILELDSNHADKLIRVKFRLKPQLSKWERIRKLVS